MSGSAAAQVENEIRPNLEGNQNGEVVTKAVSPKAPVSRKVNVETLADGKVKVSLLSCREGSDKTRAYYAKEFTPEQTVECSAYAAELTQKYVAAVEK